MSKLIVRIKGGIGNQLFCYAAARRLALVNNAELVIDNVTGFRRDQYRRQYALDKFSIKARKASSQERMEPFERSRRGLSKYFARIRPFFKRHYLEQEGNDFDDRLLDFKIKGTVYLDGYWQSEDYFKDIEKTIREDLMFISSEDPVNRELIERITRCNAVAVHVRWFDSPSSNNVSHNATKMYYDKAIARIRKQLTEPHFYVFSDHPVAARDLLNLPGELMTLVDHNPGDENACSDLWLMTHCKHFIIANSTFSWWGAWLAEFNKKIIIAPGMIIREGITVWNFKGQIPDRFIVL